MSSTSSGWLLVATLWVLAQACSAESSASQAEQPAEPSSDSLSAYAGEVPLHKLKLPAGYAVDVFAEGVENARAMAFAGDGLVFVGSREAGNVYAVLDTNGDMRADKTYIIDSDLSLPVGVALKGGDLYVSTVSSILRYRNIRQQLDAPPEPEVVYDGYPSERHHGWKFISFGPDGLLYVPVGAPCNICESDDPIFASITKLDVETPGAKPQIVAHGVRNSVGFTWHPQTKVLYFTENGRDNLGEDVPPCELNRLVEVGAHFGYPYCHGGTIADPKFGKKRSCDDFVKPVQNLAAHVAPLGMEFVTSPSFAEFAGQALLAEHGSWNRTVPIGYRITRVPLTESGDGAGYEVFIDGWLEENGEAWGRPVDLEWLADGSLLISDDMGGVIYRVFKS